MTSSRGLLASLVISAAVVGALVPAVVTHSQDAESDAQELRGPVLAASSAVDVEVAAATGVLDQLEPMLTGETAMTAEIVQEVLTRLGAEAQAWITSSRSLTDAGAGELDDAYEASRAELMAIVDVLSEVYATGIADVPDLDEQVADALALVGVMREQLVELDAAVHRDLVDAQTGRIATSTERLRQVVLVGMGALLAFLLGAIAFVLRTTRRVTSEAAKADAERDRTSRRAAFESRLMRGLEMAKAEPAVFELIGQAVTEGAPGHDAQLLVADSSRAHFRPVLRIGEQASCGVVSPLDCPATVRGQTAVFADDTSIDTCPHLRGRGCSATCVPVSVAGKTTGVVHVTGPLGAPPAGEVEVALEVVARRASERIAMVRAFELSTAQANTDALTGLANRRAVEERLREQQLTGEHYCLAYADLDHFKLLNDHHGHDAGDRALRLFSRVLRESVRPSDMAARYGGEEFVVLLPACGPEQAAVVLERIRERLAEAIAAASVPAFTCSFGLATSDDGEHLEDVIAAADAALMEAKAAGRDRIVRAGHGPGDQPLAAVTDLSDSAPAA